jgi:putative acyl-CoA dehydrogenase
MESPDMRTDDSYGYATHDVLNQPPALADYDVYGSDPVLQSVTKTFGADWADQQLHEAGRTVGSARVQELARQANRYLPELRTHDRFGNRIDGIDFHPAWHELMTLAIGHETHALSWTAQRPGAQVARAALSFMWNQGENGICCPIGMTYSAIPVLRRDPARWAE